MYSIFCLLFQELFYVLQQFFSNIIRHHLASFRSHLLQIENVRSHSLYCSLVKCVYLYKVLDSDLVQPSLLHHVLARHPPLVLPAALLQPLHQLQQSMENLYLIHIYSTTAPSS